MLREKDRQTVDQWFQQLRDPVRLVVFTQENECLYCQETRSLAQEIADLSGKVTAEVYDLVADAALAQDYGVDKIPAIAVVGARDHGVRYYGFPGGYEFTTLVEDIIAVSTGEHGLSAATLEQLARLNVPVHIQVFVTPTCPYCAPAVRLAHRLAIASDHIRADMVEAIEFPHLANRYQVHGVPLTLINEKFRLQGAAPEPQVVQEILRVMEQERPPESAWHG